MQDSSFQTLGTGKWKDMYRAAIQETNLCAATQKISDAEAAIFARARELFHETGPAAEVEREALDDALYALRALRIAAQNTAA